MNWYMNIYCYMNISLMFLFACGCIHQGLDPEHFSNESRGRREIYVFGCSI